MPAEGVRVPHWHHIGRAAMKAFRDVFGIVAAVLLVSVSSASAQDSKRITILYDAFGAPSALQKDWGYAALVEYGGKRILFDTGNNAKILEHNAKQLGINLKQLDAVVISHRHGDHTSGLTFVLQENSAVKIYAPQEGTIFNSRVPRSFLEPQPSLPPDMRYFDGKQPERLQIGSAWETANFEVVTKTIEIFPGIYVLTTRSEKPGNRDERDFAGRSYSEGFGGRGGLLPSRCRENTRGGLENRFSALHGGGRLSPRACAAERSAANRRRAP